MRKFGVDAPEMFCFQLEGDETVYKIPLAASMPLGKMLALSKARGKSEQLERQIEILAEYVGEVVYTLPTGVVSEILLAWSNESNGQGATVGES